MKCNKRTQKRTRKRNMKLPCICVCLRKFEPNGFNSDRLKISLRSFLLHHTIISIPIFSPVKLAISYKQTNFTIIWVLFEFHSYDSWIWICLHCWRKEKRNKNILTVLNCNWKLPGSSAWCFSLVTPSLENNLVQCWWSSTI